MSWVSLLVQGLCFIKLQPIIVLLMLQIIGRRLYIRARKVRA